MSVRICCEVSSRMSGFRRVAMGQEPVRDRRIRRLVEPAATSDAIASVARIVPRSEAAPADRLEPLPALEGVGQHLLVGEFQDAARGQAAGQPGDRHAGVGQAVGDEQGGAVPLEVRVGGQDHLADAARADAGLEGVDGQLVGADALQRGEPAEQDVVDAADRCPARSRASRSRGCSTTQTSPASRRGSRQIAQSGSSASVRWKQAWQWRMRSLAVADRLGQGEGLLGAGTSGGGGPAARPSWRRCRAGGRRPRSADPPRPDGRRPSAQAPPARPPPPRTDQATARGRQAAGRASRSDCGRRLAGLGQALVDGRRHQVFEQLGVAVGQELRVDPDRRAPPAGR